MYKYFRLLTITLNIEGGSAETIEKMTKEVDGTVVPCTRQEAELKFHRKLSSVGENPATQSIKCILFDADGNMIKVDEVVKPAPEPEPEPEPEIVTEPELASI